MNTDIETIVIDCQVFQTPAWDRGMGKYSLELLAALARQAGLPYENVVLLFNTSLPLTPEVRVALDHAMPSATVEKLDLRAPGIYAVSEIQKENTGRIDHFIARKNLEGSHFLILAPFLDQVCSVFPSNAGANLMLFYDTIPLLYHRRYLVIEPTRQNYLSQYRTVIQADIIFTISQTVADDLVVYLGVPEARLVNINGAPIKRQAKTATKPKIHKLERFVLMPSGEDTRKNNIRAVQGFEAFIRRTNVEFKLVLTSTYSTAGQETLAEYSNNLIFTGNVSEGELAWLYEHTALVLFATEYEGLGLPVLEAVEAGKPVACSDISAFREISTKAFYYFDPHDVASISYTIERSIITETAAYKQMSKLYPEILAQYSWEMTAQKFLEGLNEQTKTPIQHIKNKKKIAVLGPSPSSYSAIGKVIQELHPALAEHYEIDYYFDHPENRVDVRPEYLGLIARAFDAKHFGVSRYRDYHAVIYHVGNSSHHLNTIKNALYLPGYAILHDTYLDGVFGVLQHQGLISDSRLEAENALQEAIKAEGSSCLASLVNNQLGVFVHSEYAHRAVEGVVITPLKTKTLHLPVGVPKLVPEKAYREQATIGLAGILMARKGFDIIRKIALDQRLLGCQIEVFGFNFSAGDELKELRSLSNVTVYTDLTDFEYQEKLANLDILVSYRSDYRGETSLTVLEAMRHGVLNVVRGDLGWFGELPDDVVAKVSSENEIYPLLADLVRNKKNRLDTGARAQALMRREYSHEKYARELMGLIESADPENKRAYVSDIISGKDKNMLKKQAGK